MSEKTKEEDDKNSKAKAYLDSVRDYQDQLRDTIRELRKEREFGDKIHSLIRRVDRNRYNSDFLVTECLIKDDEGRISPEKAKIINDLVYSSLRQENPSMWFIKELFGLSLDVPGWDYIDPTTGSRKRGEPFRSGKERKNNNLDNLIQAYYEGRNSIKRVYGEAISAYKDLPSASFILERLFEVRESLNDYVRYVDHNALTRDYNDFEKRISLHKKANSLLVHIDFAGSQNIKTDYQKKELRRLFDDIHIQTIEKCMADARIQFKVRLRSSGAKEHYLTIEQIRNLAEDMIERNSSSRRVEGAREALKTLDSYLGV